jgi:chloramphenicol 3-O-phosphotransferase
MKLIFLHGRAAVGKLTVAKALSAKTGFAVFHNHLIVDALLAVFPFGSEPFARLRQEFWIRTFEEAAKADRSLIFTFAPERSVPDDFVPETIKTVTRHGGAMHFVGLSCTPQEQERRIENEDRKLFRKLASLETLHRINLENKGFGAIPPSDLTIDTTNAAPEESADRIVARFGLALNAR